MFLQNEKNAFQHWVAERKIKGNFIPQVYKNADSDHPFELSALEFDATEAVLSLDLKSIQALIDERLNADAVDHLVPFPLRDGHKGPFRIEGLSESVRAFFIVSQGSDVGENMLVQARDVHRINELKTYHVRVERTVTSAVWIEVQSTTEKGARHEALDKAGEYDFNNEGEHSTPDYVTSDVTECMSQEEAMAVPARPRG